MHPIACISFQRHEQKCMLQRYLSIFNMPQLISDYFLNETIFAFYGLTQKKLPVQLNDVDF